MNQSAEYWYVLARTSTIELYLLFVLEEMLSVLLRSADVQPILSDGELVCAYVETQLGSAI